MIYQKKSRFEPIVYKKGTSDARSLFSKNTFRKFSHTMEQIDAYATPLLTAGTFVVPELTAPIAGGLAVLSGVARAGNKYEKSHNKQVTFDGTLTKRARQGSALEKR